MEGTARTPVYTVRPQLLPDTLPLDTLQLQCPHTELIHPTVSMEVCFRAYSVLTDIIVVFILFVKCLR